MKRLRLSLLALVSIWCVSVSTAAEPKISSATKPSPSAHFEDPSHLLPPDPAWTATWEAKLADFERTTGLKIFVQFHPKSPSDAEDKVPGAYMHALAKRVGTVRRGALVVYFADEDDWRVWIGDETTPIFVGMPGTAKAFTENGKMHEVKEAFLAAAHAKGESAFAAAKQNLPSDPVSVKALRVKFITEALLDDLREKLGSK